MLHDGPASRVEEILALKPLCGKRWSSVFIRWRSKSLFRALVSRPVMKNEIKSMIVITKSICCFPVSRHYVGARHSFSTNEQQKVCRQPKKMRYMILHYHHPWVTLRYIGSSSTHHKSISRSIKQQQHWIPRYAKWNQGGNMPYCCMFGAQKSACWGPNSERPDHMPWPITINANQVGIDARIKIK